MEGIWGFCSFTHMVLGWGHFGFSIPRSEHAVGKE